MKGEDLMASLKKLVLTGTILTTIGSASAYYISNADVIQSRINTLYNIADNYKTTASEYQTQINNKQAILDELKTYLNASGTDITSLNFIFKSPFLCNFITSCENNQPLN